MTSFLSLCTLCSHQRSTSAFSYLCRQREPPIARVLTRKEESGTSLSTSEPNTTENDDANCAIGPGRTPSARVQRLLSRLSHLPRGGRSLREGDGEQLLPCQELGAAVRQHDPGYQRCVNYNRMEFIPHVLKCAIMAKGVVVN